MSSLSGLLRKAVRKNAAGTATIFGERKRTWADVADRVARVAGGFSELGISTDDKVAVLAMNSDRFFELHFAVPWAGAVLEPLNVRWNAAENAFALNAARAKMILVDETFLEQGRELIELCPELNVLGYIGEGDAPAGTVSYEDVLVKSEPMKDADRHGDDTYMILYTSGTTAQSKGVELTHRDAIFTAVNFHATIPLASDSTFLHLLGMFHVGAGQPIWYITMAAGTHVIHSDFTPSKVLEDIPRYRITNTVMVPTMINMLLHQGNFDEFDLTSIRTCVYGGSPMPLEILQSAMDRLPTWGFHQIYGQTESSGYTTGLTWADHKEALTGNREVLKSAGRPVPGMEAKIVGPNHVEITNTDVGEILVRGDSVMLRYFENPEQTAQDLVDGWLHTGDVGFIDDGGYLYVADRTKDMIISGGENVYSVDVERALHSHPAVRDAAVIGIPDEAWVEAVHAVVVLEDGAVVTQQQLIAHTRGLIAGYKTPKSIEFIEGPLPMTPVGKIRKNVLRDPYWVNKERKI